MAVARRSAPRYDHLYVRDEIDGVLRELDPSALKSPLVRRLAANGFATDEVLARLATRARRVLHASASLVDLGCGAGGIGLWLAEQTGARLFGIDAEPRAIARAQQARPRYQLEQTPTFVCATFERTLLPSAFAQVAVSTDALYLAPDPHVALTEARRILADSGLLLFNVYVSERDAMVVGWCGALEYNGLEVLEVDDRTEAWRKVMKQKHQARIAAARQLIDRLGREVADAELAVSLSMLGLVGPSFLEHTRRIELVARKRRGSGR